MMDRPIHENMEKAFHVAFGLSLEPVKGDHTEIAAEQHQYRKGYLFGEWRVTGAAYVKSARTANGKLYRSPMTPVVCSCGTEKDVRTSQLKNYQSQSCGHSNYDSARAQNATSWETRNRK